MHTERLTFENSRGQTLAARLDRPLRDTPRGYVLFAHCFTCSKNLGAVVQISRTLVERGWGVLRFDFTGLGDSGGDFAHTHFSSDIEDLVAAGQWLADHRQPPAMLVGHSLGGAAVLKAAGFLDSVVAVATIGAPASPEHLAHLFRDAKEELQTKGEACVELGGRKFTVRSAFLEDIKSHDMEKAIAKLGRPLLIMHAPKDAVVGVENASGIFLAAKHPKSFVSLDEADHLLSRPEDAHFVGNMVATWAERYIPPATTTKPQADVSAWGPYTGFRTELTVDEHRLIADEPTSYGGTNTGPTPYDLLLGGLGACTVMTMRMYAKHKGWPMDQAVAHLSHEKVHAQDCENCDIAAETDAKIDRIERVIEIRGDALTDEQRARLLEIADKCPVHRTLVHGPVAVVTRGAARSERKPS